MTKTRTILIAAASAALSGATAGAATRTVCLQLEIADDRTSCPDASVTGAARPCNPGGTTPAVGHEFELWDKDPDGSDELIGTWVKSGSGRGCATFEWENAAYSGPESNPDVYLRYVNRVNRSSSGTIVVRGVDTAGAAVPVTSWRNGTVNDPDAWVAVDCTAGANCQLLPNSSHVATYDTASERGMRLQALDSAQHALEVFGGIMDTDVALHYPGQAACPTSCAPARDEIHVFDTLGDHGSYAPHELGHAIQMQEFDQDFLRDVCGASHTLTSLEADSCATTEGWADYVTAVAWYEPNDPATVPFAFGSNVESSTLTNVTCSVNSGIELQVAKAFWDLDDWNDEAGVGAASGSSDEDRWASTDIAMGWRQFPDGTADGEDFETGDDGVNMWDFFNNNTPRLNPNGTLLETLLSHNCLQSQDPS
jgi:hypothetical protein